jgi:hypothetical protein
LVRDVEDFRRELALAKGERKRRSGLRSALVSLGVFVGLVVGVAIFAVAVLMGIGLLKHTPQGWVFKGGGLVPADEQLTANAVDPKQYPLLQEKGTGPKAQTASLTSTGRWNAVWAFDCPDRTGFIKLVATTEDGRAYGAGSLRGTSKGAGVSIRFLAGTYTLAIDTGPDCKWALGAKPAS